MDTDLYRYYVFFVSLAVITTILSVVFNGIVISAIAWDKSIQILENVFVVNLAVINVLLGICGSGQAALWNTEEQNTLQCFTVLALTVYTIGASVFCVSIMTMEKYIKICYPFKYIKIFTKQNVIIITVIIHVVGIIGVGIAAPFFQEENKKMHGPVCALYDRTDNQFLSMGFISFIFVVILLQAFVNLKILYIVRQKQKQVHSLERNPGSSSNTAWFEHVRGVKLLAIVVMFTFVLYVPIWTHMVLGLFVDLTDEFNEKYMLCSVPIWHIIPVVDGIAFLFCRQDIRTRAWKMIRCKRS